MPDRPWPYDVSCGNYKLAKLVAPNKNPSAYPAAITASGLSICGPMEIGDPLLWIPSRELEELLDKELRGISLAGLAFRTRSKVVKEKVCKVLGHPIPSNFKKTKSRFLGQVLDTYSQKSNNLQVWSDELSPTRRCAIIRVSAEDKIEKVKVVARGSHPVSSEQDERRPIIP